MIKQFWERRKKRKAEAEYGRGFDFAAGALLSGQYKVSDLEQYPFFQDDFDRGMLEACRLWSRMESELAQLTARVYSSDLNKRQQGHYDAQGYCDNPARGY